MVSIKEQPHNKTKIRAHISFPIIEIILRSPTHSTQGTKN